MNKEYRTGIGIITLIPTTIMLSIYIMKILSGQVPGIEQIIILIIMGCSFITSIFMILGRFIFAIVVSGFLYLGMGLAILLEGDFSLSSILFFIFGLYQLYDAKYFEKLSVFNVLSAISPIFYGILFSSKSAEEIISYLILFVFVLSFIIVRETYRSLEQKRTITKIKQEHSRQYFRIYQDGIDKKFERIEKRMGHG